MRFHEDERERREAVEPETRTAERPRPIHNVLALQRSAGNQAVSAMLAREPVAEETKGGTDKEAGIGKVTLSGVGVIPILSFSASGTAGEGGSRTTGYFFTSKLGPHSAKLIQAMLNGTILDAEVEVGGLKMKLQKSLVSQYSASSHEGEPHESWELVPQSAHVDDGSGGGGGGGAPWNDTRPTG